MTNREIATRKILRPDRFIEAIPAHLMPGAASQAREALILQRMARIADSSSGSEA